MKPICAAAVTSLCLIFTAAKQPACFAAGIAEKKVKEANRLYQKGKLDEALQGIMMRLSPCRIQILSISIQA